VLLAEVVEGPDRTHPDHRARPRAWHVRVVGVPGLRRLAGVDLDREARREPVVRREEPIEDGEDLRVLDDARDGRGLRRERVDALALQTLELVAALQPARQPRLERSLALRDLARRDQVRRDRVAVAPDRLRELGRRGHRRAGYRTARPGGLAL